MKLRSYHIGILISFFLLQSAFAQSTIPVITLDVPPQIDGNPSDWQNYDAIQIPLEGPLDIENVNVKAGISDDEIFFIFQWQDDSHDSKHKPHIWNSTKEKYSPGKQREDRFAINFGMEGDFTHDWLSGKSFKADMWHWKAARTNPIGLAHDKQTIITTIKSKKAYETKAENGQLIYILRPSDSGDKLYSTARYATKKKRVMPKYILNQNATGSITDVKAKGVWKDGQWTLELKRKLNTGNADDIVFTRGSAVPSAIAVFDHSGDENHNFSKTLTFQF